MPRKPRPSCEVCGRKQGNKTDRSGEYDGVPLGAVEPCELCGKLACPDCLAEADCCFDSKFDDTGKAPKGWKKIGANEYTRRDQIPARRI